MPIDFIQEVLEENAVTAWKVENYENKNGRMK